MKNMSNLCCGQLHLVDHCSSFTEANLNRTTGNLHMRLLVIQYIYTSIYIYPLSMVQAYLGLAQGHLVTLAKKNLDTAIHYISHRKAHKKPTHVDINKNNIHKYTKKFFKSI